MALKERAVFGDPKKILLELSGIHFLPDLLPAATRLLAPDARIALARIWLIRAPLQGDCATCRMADECFHRETCLHLAASYGHSAITEGEHWSRTDGDFRRIPIGQRKVGFIAASGQKVRVDDVTTDDQWIARADWVRSEGIRSFLGLPLRYRDATLGVLGMFSREPIGSSCREWLDMIADHLAAAIANAQAIEEIESLKQQLELENEYLREEVSATAFGELVGNSPALQKISQQIDLVAPTDSSVLILGESGTGKELVAREVHQRSNRAARPLIKVNCAAVPRELYESEFFGHAKGSFTGAVRDRAGRFELADGGTLFLDEIGEIPLDLQAKLLRVLQEGELERIGEERTRQVDVRIIAATNRDLRQESTEGRFRQDLFYRLSVFPIEIASLKDRMEDIPLLAEHFLKQFARKFGRKKYKLTLANVQQLQGYSWPGNIRELQHVLERAAILSTDGRLIFDLGSGDRGQASAESTFDSLSSADSSEVLSESQLLAFQAANIERALKQTGGKIYGQGGAAELLGIKPTTLSSRIRKLGVREKM